MLKMSINGSVTFRFGNAVRFDEFCAVASGKTWIFN